MPGESPLSMMRPLERRPRKPAGQRARRRWWPILVPVAIVIVLPVVWVWLWYYASSIAERTLAGWVEREAAAGRVYSCGSQSIGGFPFRIEANCMDAAAQIGGKQPLFAVKAKAISFAAEVWHPTQLVGEIGGPMTVADSRPATELERGLGARAADGPWTATRSRGHFHSARRIACRSYRGERGYVFSAKTADLQGRVIGGSPHDHPVIANNTACHWRDCADAPSTTCGADRGRNRRRWCAGLRICRRSHGPSASTRDAGCR